MSIHQLVDAFLADDYAAIDPQLPEIVRMLNARRAGQSWHKHGTFKEHLLGTYRTLKLWNQPPDTCLCGLFHSVYSNEYVDLALFDPARGRDVLRQYLGADVERMIHLFCVMPRTAFVQELVAAERIPEDGLVLTRSDGEHFALDRSQIAKYLIVTIADLVEQWYSWQEDTMADYPYTGRVDARPLWAATLWPGQFRPGSSALSLASRLARHLPDLGEPVPPVFGRCAHVLDKADEAAAAALYWQAATLSVPHVSIDHARNTLSKAVEHNPWVAEPHLLLAQIALIDGDFDAAEGFAATGYRLCTEWGVPWDKRVSWQGWTVWARLLRQRAAQRVWPGTLHEHNNLGLVLAEAE